MFAPLTTPKPPLALSARKAISYPLKNALKLTLQKKIENGAYKKMILPRFEWVKTAKHDISILFLTARNHSMTGRENLVNRSPSGAKRCIETCAIIGISVNDHTFHPLKSVENLQN
jgi:hypothetical protein